MNTIQIDFLQDFAELAADQLVQYDFTKPSTGNPHEVLRSYFSFKHRLIIPRPRKIHTPFNFFCPPQYTQGLAQLRIAIELGADLTPCQSRRILNLKEVDPLLNDWGIQHLHLGTELEANRPLIKGTKDVLFVFFRDDDAYFITIADHSSWTDQGMLRVLHDNFPEVIQSWQAKDILAIDPIPSDADIKKMRKHRINTALEIYPGVFYSAPGGGYAMDGTSLDAAEAVIDHVKFSNRAKKFFEEREDIIRDEISKGGKTPPEILKIKILYEHPVFVIVEETTNSVLGRVSPSEIA
jgi:hypothetical protein